MIAASANVNSRNSSNSSNSSSSPAERKLAPRAVASLWSAKDARQSFQTFSPPLEAGAYSHSGSVSSVWQLQAAAMIRKSRARPTSRFRCFHSSPEVIRLVVMTYVRFRCRCGTSRTCCSSAASTSAKRLCGGGGSSLGQGLPMLVAGAGRGCAASGVSTKFT